MESDERELLEEARLQLDSSKGNAKLDDDHLICECMCVSVGMIREILIGKEVNLSLLSEELGLGSGCSSCMRDFAQWKDKI